jgi:hypothetical protein
VLQVQLAADGGRAQAPRAEARTWRSRGLRAGRPGSERKPYLGGQAGWISVGRITSPRATAAIASQIRSLGADFDR